MCSDDNDEMILATAIPIDLLISEVIVRLPAKSIARCRCVCRSWRAAITGAAFVRRHRELSRARPPSSMLSILCELAGARTTNISFYRLPLELQPPPAGSTTAAVEADLVFEKPWTKGTRHVFLAHCDGMVTITTTTTDRVFVCNPTTREFVVLPRGSHNAELDRHTRRAQALVPVAPIGFDRWRNSYVVARYFYRTYGETTFDEATGELSQDYDIGHEVFTLGGGSGGSWELTEDPPHAIGGQSPAICTRRGIYWRSDVPKSRLLRFGLKDRAFEVVARPPTTGGRNPFDGMAVMDGKLCYVHTAEEAAALHVWMADDDDEGIELQWSLLCRIDFPDPYSDLFYAFMPTAIADDGDTLVASGADETLYRYKIHDGRMEQVLDMRRQVQYRQPEYRLGSHDSTLIHSVVPYFETLISPTACNY